MATTTPTTDEDQAQTLVGDQVTLTEEDQTATLAPSHPSQRGSVTIWTFTNDNPHNTKILDSTDHDKVVYLIKPDFSGSRTTTNMYQMEENGTEGPMLGYLEWHEFFSDKISFKGGEKVKKSKYFSNGGSFAYSFKDEQGRKYTWKGIGSGLTPSLHCEDNFNRKVPIAQFARSRLDHSVNPPSPIPAQIFLTPRAMEIKDLVLFTFIVLEKDRRINETSDANRVSAWRAESAGLFPSNEAARMTSPGVGPGR